MEHQAKGYGGVLVHAHGPKKGDEGQSHGKRLHRFHLPLVGVMIARLQIIPADKVATHGKTEKGQNEHPLLHAVEIQGQQGHQRHQRQYTQQAPLHLRPSRTSVSTFDYSNSRQRGNIPACFEKNFCEMEICAAASRSCRRSARFSHMK